MTGGPTRQDTHRITVSIADPTTGKMSPFGVWDKISGGAVDSDETKYYPGGMAPPVSIGGKKTPGNVTVSRLYRLERDHDRMGFLMAAAGQSQAKVSRQPLDIEGNVYGKAIVYTGTLKSVTPPDLDSEQSGAALLALEISVDGFPTLG